MNTPSLQSLIDRAISTMVAKTGVDTPAIQALAAAIAGASFGQYAYQDYLFQQLNPETAEEDWLYIWSSRFNIDRVVATVSSGTVTFNQSEGLVTIPEGTIIQTDNAQLYSVTQSTASDHPVPVESQGLGSAQNLLSGSELTLVTAVSGLNPDSITSNGLSGGSDIEDLEHWRDRIIAAFNQRQAVGTAIDYELWAKAAHPDVDYAWILDNTPQVGHVQVYIGQRQLDPVVSAGVITATQDYLDSQRLAGCHITTLATTPKPVDIEINGVTDPQLQSEISTALETLFMEKMGLREDLTPSEIMLAITPITSSFGLTEPANIQMLNSNEVFTIGSMAWN